MNFVIWWRIRGGHTHMRVVVGPSGAVALAGELVMRNEEFEEFRRRLAGTTVEFMRDFDKTTEG